MIRAVKITCGLCGKHATYSYDDKKEPFWEPEDSVHSVYLEHLVKDHPDKTDKGIVKIEVIR